MGYQDDYVMRTITDLVRAIARLALGKDDISYELPADAAGDSNPQALYRRLASMAEAGDINGAENTLYEELDTEDRGYLEMGLKTFYGKNYDFITELLNRYLDGRPQADDGEKVAQIAFQVAKAVSDHGKQMVKKD